MTTRYRMDMIIEVAVEAQDVIPDARDSTLFDLIEDCTGYRLTEPERRVALVAYDYDAATARTSVFYT